MNDHMTTMLPTARVGAREIIDHFLDEGTFRSWDIPAHRRADVRRVRRGCWPTARARTGLDESVITGEGTAAGPPGGGGRR